MEVAVFIAFRMVTVSVETVAENFVGNVTQIYQNRVLVLLNRKIVCVDQVAVYLLAIMLVRTCLVDRIKMLF